MNSDENPARPGSLLTVYATGAGLMNPGEEDGSAGIDGAQPFGPVSCRIGQISVPPSPVHKCEIVYAGSTSSQIAGVIQIRVRLPGDVLYLFRSDPSLELEVGGSISGPIGIPGAVDRRAAGAARLVFNTSRRDQRFILHLLYRRTNNNSLSS